MAGHIGGTLEVGPNDRGEIIINLPPEVVADFPPDIGGHLVFSPNQARNLAMLLLKHADAIDGGGQPSSLQETYQILDKQSAAQMLLSVGEQAGLHPETALVMLSILVEAGGDELAMIEPARLVQTITRLSEFVGLEMNPQLVPLHLDATRGKES